MHSTIFIPKKIRVGYQERKDTYTGKLAYVIYYDQKNKLRKEVSWGSWRNDKIDPNDFDNAPISGFVLNKKVGDYVSDWNHRQAYVRIYDPRNFEFEITIQNLLYILENANSIKGKGLEGEFVYGWDGKDLILIPVESPDYINLNVYSDMLKNPESIKSKDLVFGGTYRTNKNEDWIYLGRFDCHERSKVEKKYFFQHEKSYYTLKSLSGRIVMCVSKDPVDNYAELMEELEHHYIYSPIDTTANEYVEYTKEEVLNIIKLHRYYQEVYINVDNKMYLVYIHNGDYIQSHYNGYTRYNYDNTQYYEYQRVIESIKKYQKDNKCTIDQLHDKYHFSKMNVYLKNGKLQH